MQTTVTFHVGNRHKKRDNDHEWTFFVETPYQDDLQYIESVRVDLHSTFSPSRVLLSKPPFELLRRGWGTFEIKARIKFVDGTMKYVTHELSFASDRTFTAYTATIEAPLPQAEPMATPSTMLSRPHAISPMPASPVPMSPKAAPILMSPMMAPPPMSPMAMPMSPMAAPMPMSPMMAPPPMSPMPISPMPMSPTGAAPRMIRQPRPGPPRQRDFDAHPPVEISPTIDDGFGDTEEKTTTKKTKKKASPLTRKLEDLDISPRPVDFSASDDPGQDISPRCDDIDVSSLQESPQPIEFTPSYDPGQDISPRCDDIDVSLLQESPQPIEFTPSDDPGQDISPRCVDDPAPVLKKETKKGGGLLGLLGIRKKDDDEEKKKGGGKGDHMSPQHQQGGDFMSPQHVATTTTTIAPPALLQEATQKEKEKTVDMHGKDLQFYRNLDDRTYKVQEDDIRFFKANGFVKLAGVASAEEIAALEGAVDQVMRDCSRTGRGNPHKMNNLWRLTDDIAIRSVVFSKRLARVVAELLGVDAVRLYHDQLLMKRTVDKTSWHQDAFYWPFDDHNKVVTAWIPLCPVTQKNGALQFAAGSHLDGYVSSRPAEGEDVDKEYFNQYVADKEYKISSYDMDVGDISFHTGLCLHTGYPNTSGETRKVMSVIYYADGLRLIDADNKYRQLDVKVFWPGSQPGELAASPMHPVLFHRGEDEAS